MAFQAIVASGLVGVGAMFMVVAAAVAGASDRSGSVPAAPLVVSAFGGQSQSYKGPLTAWGEPDLQGVWSSDDTSGIPLSRPARFGERLYLTDAELADRRKRWIAV